MRSGLGRQSKGLESSLLDCLETVSDCLETVILVGNELASFIIYLREITFNVKKPMLRLELDDVTVSRHLILMSWEYYIFIFVDSDFGVDTFLYNFLKSILYLLFFFKKKNPSLFTLKYYIKH